MHQYVTSVGCERNHLSSGYSFCKDFFANLKQEFNLMEHYPTEEVPIQTLDGRGENNYKNVPYLMFQDGSAIVGYFRFYGEPKSSSHGVNPYKQMGYFHLDINGTKKPNRWGRDIFRFDITDQGYLIPQGSLKYSLFEKGDDSNTWKKANTCGPNRSTSGTGCAARIMDEGWEMKY